MGFIEGTSPKGLDVFNSTPQTTADLNRLRELIELVGNVRVGPTSARLALSGTQLYEGLLFKDTTDKGLYEYTTSGWAVIGGSRIAGTLAGTTGTGFTLGTTASLSRRGKTVHLAVQVQKSSALVVGERLLTLPSGFRPGSTLVILGSSTNAAGPGWINLLFNTDGTVMINQVANTAATLVWVVTSFEAA